MPPVKKVEIVPCLWRGKGAQMNCPSCHKEVVADRMFCMWCESLIANPSAGKKAGLLRRWFATVLDDLIICIWFILVIGIPNFVEFHKRVVRAKGGVPAEDYGTGIAYIFIFGTVLLLVYVLFLLRKGMTPGKRVLGEQVVTSQGANMGFWRMVFREVIGKFISGLFFGLGYFWAIWDKNSQAWHDKIAGTVVVRVGGHS